MPDSLESQLVKRSNGVAEDASSGANNGGHGLTATLTENIFLKSFGDGGNALSMFGTFFGAPRQVIGEGIKNIQNGIKSAKPYKAYAVGDTLTLHIDNRTKIYESRIGDLKVKLQVSLDLPPNGHVDKFINYLEYKQFIQNYKNTLSESMSFTIFTLLRVMFISSSYDMCMPYNRYEKFLLATLAKPTPPTRDHVSAVSQVLYDHADTVKALVDELRLKITNTYVFDVSDFIVNRELDHTHTFNPYNPFDIERGEESVTKLKRTMAASGVLFSDNDQEGPQIKHSREESLKAFETALATVLDSCTNPIPTYKGGQGNRGNTNREEVGTTTCDCLKRPAKLKTGKTSADLREKTAACRKNSNGQCNQCGDIIEPDVYPSNRGTVIMDKQFNERPLLNVKAERENLVLIMSREDYVDFTSGVYKGYFGSQSMAAIDFKNTVLPLVSEVIPIDGMIGGHALIMDKRMFAIIPHLDHTGTDTLNQRLATVDTIHKGFIFGMFDQFVAVRIQMVGYNARPINSQAVFFEHYEPAKAAAA